MTGGIQRRRVGAWPRSSGPELIAELKPEPTRATELLTLAVSGGRPTASRAG